jgi:hypothetical protein
VTHDRKIEPWEVAKLKRQLLGHEPRDLSSAGATAEQLADRSCNIDPDRCTLPRDHPGYCSLLSLREQGGQVIGGIRMAVFMLQRGTFPFSDPEVRKALTVTKAAAACAGTLRRPLIAHPPLRKDNPR